MAAVPDGYVAVKVSAASARQRFHGCEPGYIDTVCHGRCCESSTSPTGTRIAVLPDEEPVLIQLGARIDGGMLQPAPGKKKCPFKTATNLCGVHGTPAKPFGCIASPFVLTKRDTLIVRNRYRLLVCYKDDRDGPAPPAYVAFRSSLDLMFGAEEAARVCALLDDGSGDLVARMPADAYDKLRRLSDVGHAALSPVE